MSANAEQLIRRALHEIRDLRAKLTAADSALYAPVAIVGMGLRLPGGANDAESFARVLWEGVDPIVETPPDRWRLEDFYDADPEASGRMTARHGGYLDQVDQFDAAFFGISGREADSMDPQQRLALETTWEALENAAIAPDQLRGALAGVYLGLSNSDYSRAILTRRALIDPYFMTGGLPSVAAGRIAYVLGLTGPALVVDTACSSSLTALHLAVQGLRRGECDLAVAGGVNVIAAPEANIAFSKGRMLAPDGRCKAFDKDADGYVRAEGCVMFALKRLADARAEGDRILAIIRGSAINQDGRSSGLTAPSGPAQEVVIAAALADARVRPQDVGYVECHGTGTPLGDPIELNALAAAYGAGRETPLLIGSVKSNIGHAEAAAGAAGVAKCVLAFANASVPPNAHFRTGNPHFDWESAPLKVVDAAMSLPGACLVAVSAFGISGTNAHLILEAPELLAAPTPVHADRPAHILTISARTPETLRNAAQRWRDAAETADTLADLAYTANVGRARLEERAAIVFTDRASLKAGLDLAATGADAFQARPNLTDRPRPVFLFTGQGLNHPGMGRALYDTSPVFRGVIDQCADIAASVRPIDLRAALLGDGDLSSDTALAQPSTFALQAGLAALWRSWGVEPFAVLGHSLGEYAAACAAGVWSLEDGMRIVMARGTASARAEGQGAMVAVQASLDIVEAALRGEPDLTIASYNGPADFVLSGAPEAARRLVARFESEGRKARLLNIPFGSHSRFVEPAIPELEAALRRATYASASLPIAANLSGALAAPDEMSTASYWVEQMRKPVRYDACVRALRDLGATHWIEIGPHPALCALGADAHGDDGRWLASMRRDGASWIDLLESLARLHVDGAKIDWAGFDADYPRHRIAAPTTPFARRRHWIEAASEPKSEAAWPDVAAAAAAQSLQGPLGLAPASYPEKWALLERLTLAVAARGLRREDALSLAEGRPAVDILNRASIAPAFVPLATRWLRRLTDAGFAIQEADAYRAHASIDMLDVDAQLRLVDAALSDNKPLLDYVRHCCGLVGAVVTGRESALETLFPGGDFALAENLYQRSQTMHYGHLMAAAAVRAFAPGAKGLRVLEVGAGVGAATSELLPALGSRVGAYAYSDVSDVFLDRGRERFGHVPALRFRLFDLDAPLDPADAGAFDIIVASNAVHACADLPAALRKLKAALAPGGMLALVESTTAFAWFDITTRLIEGWRAFDDTLRQDEPLLPPGTWTQALRDAGFEEAGSWPQAGEAGEALGQHLILAKTHGALGARGEEASTPIAAMADQPAAVPQIVETLAELSPAERRDALRDFVRGQVAAVLRTAPDVALDRNSPLRDLGLDSLMAVQLRNRLSRGLALDKPLAASVMFDHPSIEALTTYLLSSMQPPPAPVAPSAPSPSPSPSPVGADRVATMSDAEIAEKLAVRSSQKNRKGGVR